IFTGGYYLGAQGYKAEVDRALHVNISRQLPPDKNVEFSLFWQVWDTLAAKYFDKNLGIFLIEYFTKVPQYSLSRAAL
ncbi:MAG: hypothetical protein UU70_C0036G0007, partial [Candidatus Yanofskybacteria bacterium GW2011_GWA1_41_6]